MLSVATVNVNGIRAACRKGMLDWIAAAQPELILMQEVRAQDADVDKLISETMAVHNHASLIKGRAGVAIASTVPILGVRSGLSDNETDVDSGRWIEVDLDAGLDRPLTAVSVYVHSGTLSDQTKMDNKFAHLDAMSQRLTQLAEAADNGGNHVLVAGDINIVRTEADIKNWKGNHNKTAGVTDPEIAYLDTWLDTQGWVDVQRHLSPDTQGPYTWWSNRGKAFDNNAGWRLDYQLTRRELAERAENFRIDSADSWDTRWSDHAPLVIDYRK